LLEKLITLTVLITLGTLNKVKETMASEEREIIAINVDLTCDEKCEECEKFFDCKNPKKWEIYKRRRMARAREVMRNIRWKIAVASGKGGVGKSFVTANLAAAWAMKGYKVSVLDHDFDGPCIPKLLGMTGKRLTLSEKGIVPATGPLGITVVSMGLIMGGDEVLTWFHDMRRSATEEFLAHVDWGQRDILLVDLPPGTSSDAVNLLQYIPDLAGVVVVTVPTDVSQGVARKTILLAAKAGTRIFGVVENMSGYVCPKCGEVSYVFLKGGGERIAEELGVPFLGAIPLDQKISEASDRGVPFVYAYPETPGAKVFFSIRDKIEEMIEKGE